MSEKIAIKSGYYFKLFDKEEVNIKLRETGKKVKYNNVIYKIYGATTIEDERKINNLFGNDMGNYIDDFEVKKPKCALIGADGNIFNLMGLASRTLKQNGMSEETKQMMSEVTASHSYDEALCVISNYVEITDQAGLEEESEEEF